MRCRNEVGGTILLAIIEQGARTYGYIVTYFRLNKGDTLLLLLPCSTLLAIDIDHARAGIIFTGIVVTIGTKPTTSRKANDIPQGLNFYLGGLPAGRGLVLKDNPIPHYHLGSKVRSRSLGC